MELGFAHKISVLSAIKESIKNLLKCWHILLLFALFSVGLSYGLQVLFSSIGFNDFYGGFIVMRLTLDAIKIIYVCLVIRTISNIMKGESINPFEVIKKTFPRLWQLIFQSIILGGFIVPPAMIVLTIMMAISQTESISRLVTLGFLGLVGIRLMFSLHGVIIDREDAIEGIKESLSITRGNFLRLALTAIIIALGHYGATYLINQYVTGPYMVRIVYYAYPAIMIIVPLALLTSLYHQSVHVDLSRHKEYFE